MQIQFDYGHKEFWYWAGKKYIKQILKLFVNILIFLFNVDLFIFDTR